MTSPNSTDRPESQPALAASAGYADVMSGRRRTWPYGTRKTVTVIHVDEKKRFILCADAEKAGYVLLGTDSDQAKENDTGVMTFTKGGPLGGYWKFQREDA